MEPSLSRSGGSWQTFLKQNPELHKQYQSGLLVIKQKPQVILGGVVAFFLLIGTFAAVSLVGVQQDIRQQASTLYKLPDKPVESTPPAVYADPSICSETHPSYVGNGFCETATLVP